MARLAVRSALHGIATPGRYGRTAGAPGLIIEEQTGLAVASVIARKGAADAVIARLERSLGVRPVDGPRYAARNGVGVLGAGPGKWLALGEGALVSLLQRELAGLAAVADQSDARAVIRLWGPRVRDALAKGVPVDLHPTVFRPGDAAATLVAHIVVQLAQLDDRPTFLLMAPRSFAASLWSWLAASAAELGYEVARVD